MKTKKADMVWTCNQVKQTAQDLPPGNSAWKEEKRQAEKEVQDNIAKWMRSLAEMHTLPTTIGSGGNWCTVHECSALRPWRVTGLITMMMKTCMQAFHCLRLGRTNLRMENAICQLKSDYSNQGL